MGRIPGVPPWAESSCPFGTNYLAEFRSAAEFALS
jgi:hypothetical protein